MSASSAYRYVAVLLEAGLLTHAGAARYVLGPAMIQYDRQIQLTDPLLRAARPVMQNLLPVVPPGSVLLLCRIYSDVVLCIDQLAVSEPVRALSYERGRPMPLFRGATSKIILAGLPTRELRRLYASHAVEIAAASLGVDWTQFHASLAALRRAGYAITRAELDDGSVGVAAPLHDEQRRVLGSLSFVVPQHAEALVSRLVPLLRGGAQEIEMALS